MGTLRSSTKLFDKRFSSLLQRKLKTTTRTRPQHYRFCRKESATVEKIRHFAYKSISLRYHLHFNVCPMRFSFFQEPTYLPCFTCIDICPAKVHGAAGRRNDVTINLLTQIKSYKCHQLEQNANASPRSCRYSGIEPMNNILEPRFDNAFMTYVKPPLTVI